MPDDTKAVEAAVTTKNHAPTVEQALSTEVTAEQAETERLRKELDRLREKTSSLMRTPSLEMDRAHKALDEINEQHEDKSGRELTLAARIGIVARLFARLNAQLTAEREKREAAEKRWADICKDAAAEYREENVYVMAVLHSMFAKYGVDLESQSAPHAETGETTPDKAQGALAKMQERRAFADMAGKAAKETP